MTKIISAIGGLRFFLSSQPQLQHPISHLHDKRYNHLLLYDDYNDNLYQ